MVSPITLFDIFYDDFSTTLRVPLSITYPTTLAVFTNVSTDYSVALAIGYPIALPNT
jgi:hypothetical protein